VNLFNDIPSAFALNVNSNGFLAGATVASSLVRRAGGKGHVLFVHGFPGATADTQAFEATKAVVANCPGMKVDEVIGGFVNATAKAEVLKYLATHPQGVSAVVQAGAMGNGVIGAFTSSGRDVPPIGDIGASEGSLAYWSAHKDTYHGIGTGQPGKWAADAVVSTALRTLAGQGPKVNTLQPPVPLISDANLDEWANPSASQDSEQTADGPRDAFLSEQYLDGLFNHGSPPAS
jgi:ribose transport system substrate-binding protein